VESPELNRVVVPGRWLRGFYYSAAFLLALTGAAKLVSATGSARMFRLPDPLLTMSFRSEFILFGIIEIAIATICVFSHHPRLKAILIAWFSSSCVLYRTGLLWIGYHKPCPCVGQLTSRLGINDKTANICLWIILGYLLIGSAAALANLRLASMNDRVVDSV
jgi:hypothetical protein